MANWNPEELEEALGVLADGSPPEKLRDRLARLNAFHSRRGMNSLHALAERLWALSFGLRREVPATLAVRALWMEHIAHRLGEKAGEKLDELADKVNAELSEDGSVRDGQDAALEQAVTEYEDLLARKVGGVAARLDTVQKAVPAVAAMLRGKPRLDVALDPPEADEEGAEGHAHEHDHAHGHDHPHGLDHAHAHGPEHGRASHRGDTHGKARSAPPPAKAEMRRRKVGPA